MSVRKWMAGAAVALVAVLALAVVGGGIGRTRQAAGNAAQGGARHRHRRPERQGLQRSRVQRPQGRPAPVGIKGRVFISKSGADYIPNLSAGAKGYDLVIAVGFLMGDSIAQVAKKYPKTKFAIIDVNAAGLKGKPKNVRGIVFAEQEAGCLAGVAAATTSEVRHDLVGRRLKIPPVDAYIAGYQYCAKKVKPGIKTLNGYSQDFVDSGKCKEIALEPDRSGLGRRVPGRRRLRPRRHLGRCGQRRLGHRRRHRPGLPRPAHPHERAEEGRCRRHADDQARHEGKYKGGVDGLFNVKNGGVGYGKVSAKAPARAALIAKLNAWAKQIAHRQGQAPAHRYRQRLSGSQDRTTREGGLSSPPSLRLVTADRHGPHATRPEQ